MCDFIRRGETRGEAGRRAVREAGVSGVWESFAFTHGFAVYCRGESESYAVSGFALNKSPNPELHALYVRQGYRSAAYRHCTQTARRSWLSRLFGV